MEDKVSFHNEELSIAEVIKTPPSLTFWDNNQEVGNLSWDGGEFRFEGNAHKSAQRFIKWLKELWKNYP